MNLNKGDCKRNRLIVEFINEFNDKYKRKQPLPEILTKESVVISMTRKREDKENQSKKKERTTFDFTSGKSTNNPLLANTPA